MTWLPGQSVGSVPRGARIAALSNGAVRENIHRAASRARALAVVDLGLAGSPIARSVRWFEVDEGTNHGTFSRYFRGYVGDERIAGELCPVEPGARLRGFIFSSFDRCGELWVRRTHDPVEAAGTVLHEAAHSAQVGHHGGPPADREAAEAEARTYAARMLVALQRTGVL